MPERDQPSPYGASPVDIAERLLPIFLAMGPPERIRRNVELFEEICRERRSPAYRQRQAAIDAMLEERRGRRYIESERRGLAKIITLYAGAIMGGWYVLNQLAEWLHAWIETMK
jgi:hypothetical protein